MIANLVSLFVASRLQHEPIYEALAVQDGIHLPSSKARQRHGQRQISKVMHAPGELLPAEMTVRGALERFRSSAARTWLVTDLRGVIGVINLSDWSRNWRKTRTGRSPIWSTRSIFRTFTPTIRWIWRWSAWDERD